MKSFKTHIFPATRIATLDICTIGLKKHHIAAFAEADVTESRRKIREFRKQKATISFFAWLIKVISMALKEHPSIAGYLKGKRTLVVFDDINVSVAVEKDVNESKVPIPLIIEKADKITIEAITGQIGIADGDFAMLITRTADNLRQIASLKESHPETASLAFDAMETILREPVVCE